MDGQFWVVGLIAWLLIVIPLWRIFRRAGFSPAWALLSLFGPIGLLAALGVLALRHWPADAEWRELAR